MSRVVVSLSVVHCGTSFYKLLWVLNGDGTTLGIACILFQSFLLKNKLQKKLT
jgi:hypothetical protein